MTQQHKVVRTGAVMMRTAICKTKERRRDCVYTYVLHVCMCNQDVSHACILPREYMHEIRITYKTLSVLLAL
jgi:hypothetical protein